MGRGGGGGGGGSHSFGGATGGSRSHGSGGGRSFGGSSSRSSRGGSSYSSSHRGGGSYHHSSGPHIHVGGPPVYHHHHYGGYYGGGGYYRAGGGFAAVMAIFATAIILIVLFTMLSGPSGVSKSTIEREPIKPYASFDKNAIDDDAGWITNKKALQKGMESFYKETGVQPALAIYESINGEKYLSDSDIESFMTDEYDELIGHEKGVLLLFCEYADSDYYAYYMVGEDAQTVMDSEAEDILMDYVHALYTDSSLSDEEFFGKVFEKTADRIMTVTPTVASKIPIIVIGIVVIAIIIGAVSALKAKHRREAEKAKETERILNSHIDRI